MILQRDSRLNKKIQKRGCYFMTILFLVNKYNNCALDTGIINNLYQMFVNLGYMNGYCYINDPDAMYSFLGLMTKYTDKHESKHRKCKPDEIEALHFQLGKWEHFTAGDGKGNVTYDPYGISRAVRDGKLKDKRIFRRIG